MSRYILAATSDWHAALGAWVRRPDIRGDAFFALRQIYQFCMEHQVDLLGAGDLLDSQRPDTQTLHQLFQFLNDLRRVERHVYFTQGQHEKASPPYLGLTGMAEHMHRRVQTIRGLSIYGLDHTEASHLPAEIEAIPPVDLIMCHQVWGNFMGVGVEGRLEDLNKPGGAAVILTGDYHEHRVLEVEGTQVLSPGSTCLQHIAEPREKSFFALKDDMTIESIPLRTRLTHDVLLETEKDLERLLEQVGEYSEPQSRVPPEIVKNILYVQAQNIPDAFRRVSRAYADKVHLFWKSLVGISGDSTVVETRPGEARGLLGCLPEVAIEGTPLYRDARRILEAADKKSTIAAMQKEFLE